MFPADNLYSGWTSFSCLYEGGGGVGRVMNNWAEFSYKQKGPHSTRKTFYRQPKDRDSDIIIIPDLLHYYTSAEGHKSFYLALLHSRDRITSSSLPLSSMDEAVAGGGG